MTDPIHAVETDPGKLVRQLIDQRVSANPDADINAPELREELGDPNVSMERVSGVLRRLAATGMLQIDRREKVEGRQAAKDRKVIQYHASDVYKRLLGLVAAPAPAADAASMIRSIHTFAEARGFVCALSDIANYFLCLQAKPFVLLSGISGTGKTRLPRLVAEATDSAHQLVPVKPNWSDNSDLMGYYSVTLNRFVSGPLLEVIRAATDDPGRPHFVVLDEMNLAHVEHYLSDMLSVMETRRRSSNGEVISDPLPVDIPTISREPLGHPDGDGASPHSLGARPTGGSSTSRQDREYEIASEIDASESLRDLVLPWNLFIVGTVNVDETTHPFSRKVLDRSFAIDSTDVDLTRFGSLSLGTAELVPGASGFFLDRPLAVQEVYPSNPGFFDEIAGELTSINAYLRSADLHFAYRVRDEIALYMWAWKRHALEPLLSRDEAFDLCLLQKILPRCQGSSETARRALEAIIRHTTVIVTHAGDERRPNALTAEDAAHPAEAAATDTESANVEQPASVAISARAGDAPIDPFQLAEPSVGGRWRYPRTAQKALAMLRRYVDTGYFAFWS